MDFVQSLEKFNILYSSDERYDVNELNLSKLTILTVYNLVTDVTIALLAINQKNLMLNEEMPLKAIVYRVRK